jgi:hypothetical protein
MVKQQYKPINQEPVKNSVVETSQSNTRKSAVAWLVAAGLIIGAVLLALGVNHQRCQSTASLGYVPLEDLESEPASSLGDVPLELEDLESEPTSSLGDVPLEDLEHARPCSFDECYATSCDAEFAPYTCLFHNGGPHGGCSDIPWVEDTCSEQCDLKDCSSIAIPDDVDSCENQECDDEWCLGGQVCPSDAKYQCMAGSARFGCSTDMLHWTLKTDGPTCSKCCDTVTC